jgi:pyruvate/oxaloacetate carboxyltransferase
MTAVKKYSEFFDVVMRDAHRSILAHHCAWNMLPITQARSDFWSVLEGPGWRYLRCDAFVTWAKPMATSARLKAIPPADAAARVEPTGPTGIMPMTWWKFIERAAFNGVDVFRTFSGVR